eukprot:789634-Rhodomonas_salina.1
MAVLPRTGSICYAIAVLLNMQRGLPHIISGISIDGRTTPGVMKGLEPKSTAGQPQSMAARKTCCPEVAGSPVSQLRRMARDVRLSAYLA